MEIHEKKQSGKKTQKTYKKEMKVVYKSAGKG